MSVEQYGLFIEIPGEDGTRNLVRVSAIQYLCDVDQLREETYLTVANRTILVREPLDDIRRAILETALTPRAVGGVRR